MKKFYQMTTVIAVLFFAMSTFGQSQNLAKKIITQAELPPHTLHHFSNTVRTQYLQIDFSQLNEHSVFSIMLFDNHTLNFKYKNAFHYKAGSSSWYGESTEGSGDVIFSFYQGNIKGIIKDNQMKKYMLQQVNLSDIFAITEVNTEAMQETPSNIPDFVELPASPHKKSRANANVCEAVTSCGAMASVIDLMVLGNADAITDAGGTVAAFITDVTTAVTEMNTAYTTSGGLLLTFDLVHCDSYAFIPTASSSADLSTFRSDPAVTFLRNLYFADLCGLWVGSGTYAGACGIGYVNTNEDNYSDQAAFTVTDFDCGMTNLTYAHECGHNMGLRHDYFVDASVTPCDHHHGYTNQAVLPSGMPVSARWRTIMAYNNECSSNGFNCTRLPRWSNPLTSYLGDATGRAIGMPEPADEIYGFARFRCVVSEFRSAGIPLPFLLTTFGGEAVKNQIWLNWQTSAEKNSRGFDIEMRRSFNDEYTRLAFVAGQGNSSATTSYKYIMNNAVPGNYYFRLKQTDQDNNFNYSEVVKVEITGNDVQASIYPNPAKNEFNISFYNPRNQQVKISIHDIAGKEVLEVLNDFRTNAYHQLKVQSSGLGKGLYFCKLVCGYETNVIKLMLE